MLSSQWAQVLSFSQTRIEPVCGRITPHLAINLLTGKFQDMVAALGETTAGPSLPSLRDRMLENPEGRRILKARPRINTRTVDMKALSALPENSFGHTYISWLERCNVTPDSREPVSTSSLFFLLDLQ